MYTVSFIAGMAAMWGLIWLWKRWKAAGPKIEDEESRMNRPPSTRP